MICDLVNLTDPFDGSADYLASIFVQRIMPAATEPIIKQRLKTQFLRGDSRDRIETDNDLGTSTVSNILDEWKKAVQVWYWISVIYHLNILGVRIN
jgi:hypothetical protein